MKLIDYIRYSFLKVVRDKKNLFYIILLVLCFVILLSSLMFKSMYLKSFKDEYENNVMYRKVIVSPGREEYQKYYEDKSHDYQFNRILDISEVQELIPFDYDLYTTFSPTFKNEKYSGYIELLYGSQYNLPDVSVGKSITSNDTGFAICDKNFYPSSVENGNLVKKEDYINGETLIGTSFLVEEDSYSLVNGKLIKGPLFKKEFKIIGVFEDLNAGQFHNTCYINFNDMRELFDNTKKAPYEGNNPAAPNYLVTIDDYKNVSSVKKQIVDLGFRVKDQMFFDNSLKNTIELVCTSINIVSCIGVLIITILYTKKRLLSESGEIGLMKAIGYHNKNILIIMITKMIIMLVFSLILGIILFELIFVIISNAYANYLLYHNQSLQQNCYSFVIATILFFVISIFANYIFINSLLKKYNPLFLIKGEEK